MSSIPVCQWLKAKHTTIYKSLSNILWHPTNPRTWRLLCSTNRPTSGAAGERVRKTTTQRSSWERCDFSEFLNNKKIDHYFYTLDSLLFIIQFLIFYISTRWGTTNFDLKKKLQAVFCGILFFDNMRVFWAKNKITVEEFS